MKMSKMYMPTLREVPSDADIPSHQLLLRAGMIRQLVSGIYSYLPLGYRVIRKIEQIVREEMDNAGSQELLMSAIQPRELWEATGRWEDFGPEMWKLRDRNNREFCLGPTHEEYFTNLIKDEIKSYKQLPLSLYQIQTKYRDEKRPRFGLMRCREFIMKDAYSFDINEENMVKAYDVMWDAYDKVFTRLHLNYKIVEGDTGAMGGKKSHEFMAMSDVGEALVAFCDSCNYAATEEKAAVVYNINEDISQELEMEKISTPAVTTIEGLMDLFNLEGSKFAKALVYNFKGSPIMAIIPGDRELNETKLNNYLGAVDHDIELASEEMIRDITGAAVGFTGPIGLKKEVKIIVDSSISKMKNLVVGGNETDFHIKNVNYGRDFKGEIATDLLLIREGDKCPKCNGKIGMERGIEVGNIFQLGSKYSDGIGAKYLDEDGKARPFLMGSYGIGVSRSVAAVVEQYHDEKGIVWPMNLAPYHVIITVINIKNEEQMNLAQELYNGLKAIGAEVLLDDRNERPGIKFNDRDLIGIPIRLTVGKMAGQGIVEYSLRNIEEKQEISGKEVYQLVGKELKNS